MAQEITRIPSYTTTERNALSSPPTGLLILNSSIGRLQQWDGFSWVTQSSANLSFVQESPSGVVDGLNTAFTLSQTPASNASLMLFLAGFLLTQGTTYTISGTSVTFAVAPISGILIACYTVSS
jgi:hypothetical protein